MIYYYSLNQYLKNTFGQKVYKISLDGGFTCPNRDGKLDTRGCIFCSSKGSGDFASNRSLSIEEQIQEGKERLENKYKKKKDFTPKYIAYFQSFTNTYAHIDKLRELYLKAIQQPKIVALSIATRPDCLPDNVLLLFEELNKIKPVWVELGLQTIHPQTAAYIRRGYELSCYDEAVKNLQSIGLPQIITHMIIGLPGETKEMIQETASYIGKSGANGIKLQLLHILKNTDLAKDYLEGKFSALTLDEYIEILMDCLAVLPKDMVIHRLTGDGDKKILLDPLWSGDKKKVLATINKNIQPYQAQ